ncbi:MAG: ribosome recycling factor [Candidatus Omnitrophica bacterium]|nr:ribosome recycling factor [Candidatus Omnitrophota bacterium]MDD5351802.1 ribosome recycling factor [Candidatus Omnitrophota bacterium]MDD5550628.1 ribosome recycling factor [Candidatus Omnitrophota bacterium]
MTKDILKDTEDKMKHALDSMMREFSEIRTGRANPHIVEGIKIDYYGTPTLIKQIAAISVPDARLIVIQPWDITAIQEIEKAILKSNLGLNPANDGKVIRLAVPQLSKERREELIKLVKDLAEKGRVSLRTIRRDNNELIKKLEQEKKITEDDRFKTQDNIQKVTDKHIEKIDNLLKEKEKELAEF